jgi:hypothetical protein
MGPRARFKRAMSRKFRAEGGNEPMQRGCALTLILIVRHVWTWKPRRVLDCTALSDNAVPLCCDGVATRLQPATHCSGKVLNVEKNRYGLTGRIQPLNQRVRWRSHGPARAGASS